MSPESAERVCEVCSSEIPKWKAKGTAVCSVACRFTKKDQQRKESQEKAKAKRAAARKDLIVFHNCIYYGSVDPYVPEKCRCRKFLNEEAAKELVGRGEALDLDTRLPTFTGGPIVQVGKTKRTPRSATLEKAHFSRLVEKPKSKAKLKDKSVEELEAAVAEDRAARFEEERLRLHVWGEMRHEFYDKLTVESPAAEFDKRKAEDWGRPGIFHVEEERTSVGVNVPHVSGESSNDFSRSPEIS